jgi:hypothetical protein
MYFLHSPDVDATAEQEKERESEKESEKEREGGREERFDFCSRFSFLSRSLSPNKLQQPTGQISYISQQANIYPITLVFSYLYDFSK